MFTINRCANFFGVTSTIRWPQHNLKISRNNDTILIKCEFLYFTAHCLPKETGKKSVRGIFEWQLTVIGGTSSRVKCPYGPPEASATRSCGGNFLTGGVWKSPDVSLCKYKSARTNKLNDIAKVGHLLNSSVALF